MTRSPRLLITAAACAVLPALAFAQGTVAKPPARATTKRPAGPPKLAHVTFAATVSASATSTDFDQLIRFTAFSEQGSITGPVNVQRGPRLDAHFGYRLWRRLGVGVTVSHLRSSGDLQATFSIPHPFLVGRPQEVTGDASSKRIATDVHLGVLLGIAAGPKWHVVVSGGPSMTFLSQEFGYDLFAYQFEFPFTSISLTPNDTRTKGQGIGGHAAVSMTRMIGRRWGIHGDIRYASTTPEMEGPEATFTLELRGVQVSAGIGFKF